MIIKTRKLPATSTEGARMRATGDDGSVLTVPFPYAAGDAHAFVAGALAAARGYGDDPEYLTGQSYRVEE